MKPIEDGSEVTFVDSGGHNVFTLEAIVAAAHLAGSPLAVELVLKLRENSLFRIFYNDSALSEGDV